MAWTYLAESEDSLLPWLPGCEQSPIVRSTDTLPESYFHRSLEADCITPLFGMTSEHLPEETYLKLTSSQRDGLARTSVSLEREAAEKCFKESEAD